jgi:predicted nucleotidyltransferase
VKPAPPTGPGQSPFLLLCVADILEREGIPYAVIGAMAASIHGVVRASLDADAVLFLDRHRYLRSNWHSLLTRRGWSVTGRKGDSDDPIGMVVHIEDRFRNRVDLLMGLRGMDEDALNHRIQISFAGKKVSVISLEDFVAMKLYAGSPKDIEPGFCIRTRHSTNAAGLFLPQKVRPMSLHRPHFFRRKSLGLLRLGARA